MRPPWSWVYTTSPSKAPPLWAGPGRSRVSTAKPTAGAPEEPVSCSSLRMTTWSTARKTTRPAIWCAGRECRKRAERSHKNEEQSCSDLERRPWGRQRRGPPCQRGGGQAPRVVGFAHGRGRRQDQPRGADRGSPRRLLLHG